MTPYQMELGGKDACIVCADADIDLAAKNIVKVCSGPEPRSSCCLAAIICLHCVRGCRYQSGSQEHRQGVLWP